MNFQLFDGGIPTEKRIAQPFCLAAFKPDFSDCVFFLLAHSGKKVLTRFDSPKKNKYAEWWEAISRQSFSVDDYPYRIYHFPGQFTLKMKKK